MNKTSLFAIAACAAAASLLATGAAQGGAIRLIEAGTPTYTLTFSGAKNKIPSDHASGSYFEAETDAGNAFYINSVGAIGSSDEGVFCTFPTGQYETFFAALAPNQGYVYSIRNLLSIAITCSGVSAGNGGIFLSLYSTSSSYGLPSGASASRFYTDTITTPDPVTLTSADFGAAPADTYFNVGLPGHGAAYAASIVSLVFAYAC